MVREPITAESVMDAKQIDGIVRALTEDVTDKLSAGGGGGVGSGGKMFAALTSPGTIRQGPVLASARVTVSFL